MKKLNLSTIGIKFKDIQPLFNLDNPKSWKIWFTLALALGLISFLMQKRPDEHTPAQAEVSVGNLDTYIPENQSIVPIQVANYESLDQVIGQFGVVDLYTIPMSDKEKSQKIAHAVKLVRSPKSPRHFNVLLPADEAYRIAGHSGEFNVTVRNPKLVGTKIVKEKTKAKRRRVFYQSE